MVDASPGPGSPPHWPLHSMQDPEKRVYGLFLKDYKPTRW
jgi:hypothetical protein